MDKKQIVIAKGSEETIIHLPDINNLPNSEYEIVIQESATLHHYTVEDRGTLNINVIAESGAVYDGLLLFCPDDATTDIDGEASVQVTLNGEGASSVSNALFIGAGKQKASINLLTKHKSKNTSSTQLSRGVLTDSADFAFNGLIEVEEGISQVVGNQLNEALLLSDEAKLHCLPELSILSEDVKCTHGAALGNLDEDALFYMQTRGIPEMQAKHLLIEAFLCKFNDSITDNAFREEYEKRINAWLMKYWQ